MTKDVLRRNVTYFNCDTEQGLFLMNSVLDNFFNSNVVIPRGENRHPDADVLHQLVENMNLHHEINIGVSEEWVEDPSSLRCRYRIKPSEPIYEFMYYDRSGGTLWSAKDDAPINMWCAEETKRVRT